MYILYSSSSFYPCRNSNIYKDNFLDVAYSLYAGFNYNMILMFVFVAATSVVLMSRAAHCTYNYYRLSSVAV